MELFDHDFVFGHVARLVPIKGQNIYYKFCFALQQYKNIKLIIIGGGRIEKSYMN